MSQFYKSRNPMLMLDGSITVEVKYSEPGHILNNGEWHEYSALKEDDPESISMALYSKHIKDPKLKHEQPPTEEEIRAKAETAAREHRDQLLVQSDWTQLPDVPEATRLAWAEYRQLLRDVPSQSGFPSKVNWPETPT